MELKEKFYKSTEVAEIIGVSLRTLYRYMDSGKIGSVKLPSGRHRFTKDHIENFLYTNGITDAVSNPIQNNLPDNADNNQPTSVTNLDQGFVSRESANSLNSNLNTNPAVTQPQQSTNLNPLPDYLGTQKVPVNNQPIEPSNNSFSDNSVNIRDVAQFNSNSTPFGKTQASVPPSDNQDVVKSSLDQELDDLLDSLDNDVKTADPLPEPVSAQQPISPNPNLNQGTQNNVAPVPVQNQHNPVHNQGFSSPITNNSLNSNPVIDNAPLVQQQIQPNPTPVPDYNFLDENKIKFFYCPHKELKHIARVIKKTADDSGKNYAFTMHAGYSLYGLLDPFSVIHFYSADSDLNFWIQSLHLEECFEEKANVGILLSKEDAFSDTREVSGLRVVSSSKMVDNFRKNGYEELANTVSNPTS